MTESVEEYYCTICGKKLDENTKTCIEHSVEHRNITYGRYYKGKKRNIIIKYLTELEERYEAEIDKEFIADVLSNKSTSQFTIKSLVETAFYFYCKTDCRTSGKVNINEFATTTKTKQFIKELFDEIGLNRCRIESTFKQMLKDYSENYEYISNEDSEKIIKIFEKAKNLNIFSGKAIKSILPSILLFTLEKKPKKSELTKYFKVARPTITNLEKELRRNEKELE